MKELLNNLKRTMLKPAYKVNNGLFALIAVIGFVLSDILPSNYGIVLGSILLIIFTTYLIILKINKNSDGQLFIFYLGEVISILIILINYLEVIGKNIDVVILLIPILIIGLLFAAYKHIVISGDTSRIEKAKILLILGIFLMIIMFAVMFYATFFIR